MNINQLINPFYQSRVRRPAPQLARLPEAPVNGSPVPHLTSLYHKSDPGHYGSRSYPGNCSGNLIRDLLLYFQPDSVFDPMTGSGTCRDVCQELNILCESNDLKHGFDACDPMQFTGHRKYDFVWIHPPYWRMKVYSDSPDDLSAAPVLDEFLLSYRQLILNCTQVLNPGGHLAILMGDYRDSKAGFVPLTYHTKRLAFESGLIQQHTDIIRFSHGNTSSQKTYRSSFIPGLHDVCAIFTKPSNREVTHDTNR